MPLVDLVFNVALAGSGYLLLRACLVAAELAMVLWDVWRFDRRKDLPPTESRRTLESRAGTAAARLGS